MHKSSIAKIYNGDKNNIHISNTFDWAETFIGFILIKDECKYKKYNYIANPIYR